METVGQASYNSSISEHLEYLPLASQVMAAKGCDGMLFGLIRDLLQAGILKTLQPGYSAFTGGEVIGVGQL